MLYESGDYKSAEHHLYTLHHVLANEAFTNADLVAQVLWGLLACQVVTGKSREVVETTTVRKLKETIKIRLAESPMQMLHQTAWLLHWSLVYSFTSENSNGLFATLIGEKTSDAYLNVIQIRCPNLKRYMIASFLLARAQPPSGQKPAPTVSKNSLQIVGLPIVLADQEKYSDAFTKFTVAMFEDIDLDEALKLAAELGKEAENDILLRPYAEKLKRQALLYVFEVQTRLIKKNLDLTAFAAKHGVKDVATASAEIQANLKEDGQFVQLSGDGNMFSIHGNKFDAKGQINQMTKALLKRTEDLNRNYLSHVQSMGAKKS